MKFDKSLVTILIVDDTPENISILAEYLSGYKVRAALDGYKAISLIESGLKPTLVLLDIMMLGMDGYEVCSRMKKHPNTKDVPIIFISAMTELEDKIKGFKMGAVDYITKPFQLEEVKSRIETHITLALIRKELQRSNEILEEKVQERTRELLAAKEKAEEANRLKSSFLSLFSHEMRTPLAGILGFAEALRDGVSKDEQIAYIKYLIDSAQRLKATIESILTLKSLESETRTLEPSRLDVGLEVKEFVEPFNLDASFKGLELEYANELLSQESRLDRKVFKSIFNNIVSNAIKYTEKGKISVRLYEETIQNKRYICFAVRDTGPGIPSELHKVIFEEFRQVDEGMKRNFEGVGLGLSLVKKYVDLAEGILELESKIGSGSVFTVKLKDLSETAAVVEPELVETTTQHKPKVSSQDKPCILIVEDDHVNVEIARLYLRNDYSIDVANDGISAIEMAEKYNYPLILMDINLGKGMSGVEVTRELRQKEAYKTTPIIACTAFAMEGDGSSFLAAGCSHYLTKPYRKIDLLNIMSKALGR